MDGLKDVKECPKELYYIWVLFCEIKLGCEDITYIDINAFNKITGSGINYFEAKIIIEIDRIRRLGG